MKKTKFFLIGQFFWWTTCSQFFFGVGFNYWAVTISLIKSVFRGHNSWASTGRQHTDLEQEVIFYEGHLMQSHDLQGILDPSFFVRGGFCNQELWHQLRGSFSQRRLVSIYPLKGRNRSWFPLETKSGRVATPGACFWEAPHDNWITIPEVLQVLM